jgi:protoporphyrin/coproporphyrin ferrochelatase
MQAEKAIILVNVGTPDSPEVRDVRKYLRQFLGDRRIIALPWLFRKILVNMVITPFRAPKSAKLYQSIWTNEGSPLLVNSKKLKSALQLELGASYDVYLGMRYGLPALGEVVKELAAKQYRQVVLLPLYPQYADSTTGTTVARFQKLIKQSQCKSEIRIIEPFFNQPGFIESFRRMAKSCHPERYDHVLFSFHGLPVRQTVKMHPGLTCEQAGCFNAYSKENASCYRASCYETARLLATALKLPADKFSVSFQSRFGKNWLQPFTDSMLKEKAARGVKKILIISPAFVADCLETIHELGLEYKRLFLESGGEELKLVESLNDDPGWVTALAEIITTG